MKMEQNKMILDIGYRQIECPIIFGITEQFDKSVKLFAKLAGWKHTDGGQIPEILNYSGKRREEVSQEVEAAIRKHNEIDYKIYKKGLEIFDKQLKYFNI